MKKFICCLLAVVSLICCNVQIFATNITIDKCEPRANMIDIEGNSGANGIKEVGITLKDSLGTIVHLSQFDTEENGDFDYAFAMPATAEGIYNIAIEVRGEGTYTKQIGYISNTSKRAFLNLIMTDTETAVYNKLSQYKTSGLMFADDSDDMLHSYAKILNEKKNNVNYAVSDTDNDVNTKFGIAEVLCDNVKDIITGLNSCSYMALAPYFDKVDDNGTPDDASDDVVYDEYLFNGLAEYVSYKVNFDESQKNRFANDYLISFTKTEDNVGSFRESFKNAFTNYDPTPTPTATPKPIAPPGGGGGGGGVINRNEPTPQPTKEPEYDEPVVVFTDLDTVTWAKECVENLHKRGVISTPDDGRFNPLNPITREEFIKMLVIAMNVYNENAVCDFVDVDKNDWFYRYVASAKNAGITEGYEDNSFGSGKNITRQEIAAMSYRAASIKGIKIETGTKELFSDDADVAEYAKTAVYAMRSANIIDGIGNNIFMPQDNASRAAAAKIIEGILNLT